MFSYRWLKFNYGMLSFPGIHPIVFSRNLLDKIYIISNIHRYQALNDQSNEIGTVLFSLSFSEMTEHAVVKTIKISKTYIELGQARGTVPIINS